MKETGLQSRYKFFEKSAKSGELYSTLLNT